MARAATAAPRAAAPVSRVDMRPGRATLALAFVVAAASLLVGSALGFGLASSVTPTSEAGTPYAGFGFLPLRGWTVVQGGQLGPDGATTATAANVQLDPDDLAGGPPTATLQSLPRRGVVIHATFTTRGDPGEDYKFEERSLPLDLASGEVVTGSPLTRARPLAVRRLRAGVGSYNVAAVVYFGSAEPPPAMLSVAQEQLNRLVVASEQVSIFARPLVTPGRQPVTLFGAIADRRGGELVDIQARDCGQGFFRGVTGTQTRDGGSWSTEYTPEITTTLRAVWDGKASPPVVVRAQAEVDLSRRGSSQRYRVSVTGKTQFWRRQVEIQRRTGSGWRTVRKVTLTETYSYPGVGWMISAAEFRASFPRGSRIRAVLPLSQARPCYLAGTSRTLTT